MKKFFTTVPLQVNLTSYHYDAVDNDMLEMEGEISFPILAAINGYAKQGEEIRVIAVMTDLEPVRKNGEKLRKDVMELCRKKGLALPNGVEFIRISNEEQVSAQTDVFQKLIDLMDDNDDLYACITYGTKPQSMVMQMAIQYAYRVKTNASIGCIVYGKVTRLNAETAHAEIFDMTLLVRLDEMVRMLADKGVRDPQKFIRQILSR